MDTSQAMQGHGASGSFVDRLNLPAPTLTTAAGETIQSRLQDAGNTLRESIALCEQMLSHVGVPLQPDKPSGEGGPGLAGLTMALRSDVIVLRSRLEALARAL